MKPRAIVLILSAVVAALGGLAAAQTTSVRGTVLDVQGKPLPGATVEFVNTENGQKYSFKTDKNGQYFSLGIAGGSYNINLLKDGQVLSSSPNIPVSLQNPENYFNFDLRKSAASTRQMSEEERKRREAASLENQKIENLNKMLAEANAAQKAGNYDQAVQIMTQATQMDPSRDLLWAALGESYLKAGLHTQGDRAKANENFTQAAAAYQKAIEINPNAGAYHNNLGESYARLRQWEKAGQQYQAAAQVDPANAARYYFNQGAAMTNAGKTEEANAAFDKAIAADPNFAEAYYQKAINYMAKATVDKQGKYAAPPEVAADLNKYLELSPNGPNAQTAKEMLAALGAKVETSYQKGKGSAQPKR
jgi:tetratricopeptide (TPR) repeat protein